MRKQLLVAAILAAVGLTSTNAMADGSTTVGGKMFFDFTNLSVKDNGVKTDASGYGVDVPRFYFGANHKFDDNWSANITTDFNFKSNDGETQVFIKKAFFQYKFDGTDAALRFGSADMPWIPFVEGVYGLRYFEKTITDRLGFANSADWGVHLLGKGGKVNYAVSAVNGGGYKNPTRSKGMDFEGRLGVTPVAGLNIAVGAYTGKRGKDFESTPALHTASRWDVLAGYNTGQFNVGGEYFHANNWKTVTSVNSDSASGYSVWGGFNVTPGIMVFARYDHADPSKDIDSSLTDKYYNVGVQFAARRGVTIAGGWKHEKLSDDTGIDIKSDEFGVWTEVKF